MTARPDGSTLCRSDESGDVIEKVLDDFFAVTVVLFFWNITDYIYKF